LKQQFESVRSGFLLLLAAFIWGIAFVAQSVSMDYIGGFTFNAVRNLIGALTLLPVIWGLGKTKAPEEKKRIQASSDRKTLITGGICCGILLCFASNFQQFGIKYTSVGKAGFITACYIVIVPIIGIFLKKKCSPFIWIAVILSLCGLYLLCLTPGEGFAIGKGELLVLICAFLFSLHILTIDHFSPLVDGVKMSCIQFLVCGILSGIPALIFESPDLAGIFAAKIPVLYAGVMSCGVAYTLQIVGQKNMNPTVASLILSLESCISVIAGWLILGQNLSSREIFGCVLMFGAIILAQLPQKGTAF
jgi:drug/metabolite transporter (DMT)-like permease